ncbi:hypothetical protein P7C71_g1563, partial [Lecanoromycetidae sp. Uapishka_2]
MTHIQPGQMTFTARMEDPEDMSTYPDWLQLKGKKDNNPRKRAREIYKTGTESSREESCIYCVGLKIPCIRAQGAKFGKCCSCTMKDMHPEGVCRLEGQPLPDNGDLKPTALNKIKQVEKEIAKVQKEGGREESSTEGGFGQFQTSLAVPTSTLSNTLSVPRSEPPRGMRSFAPSPEPASMQPTFIAGLTNSGSDATLERVTVLENQVAQLEAQFLKLRVKLQEIESSVAIAPATLAPIADRASTANSDTGRKLSIMEVAPSTLYTASIRSPVIGDTPIRRPSTMNIHKVVNHASTFELPAGPAMRTVAEDTDSEVTPKHTVAHAEEYNSESRLWEHTDHADDADSDMTDAI